MADAREELFECMAAIWGANAAANAMMGLELKEKEQPKPPPPRARLFEAEIILHQVWRLRVEAGSEEEARRRLLDAEDPVRGTDVVSCDLERREVRRLVEVEER